MPISLDDISTNIDSPASLSNLSSNKNITLQLVRDNPQLPWNWFWLSLNCVWTFDDVFNNLDLPWNWTYLSHNRFEFDKERKRRAQLARIITALTKLQQRFLHRYYRPTRALCKKRKLRQFEEIIACINTQ
jgi:hypothetical protein